MHSAKILIVEDELIPAANIARNLKKKGYTVMTLMKSGKAALELIAQDPPDLVLMDIHLQGEMDGIETVQEMMKHYTIPVIYLTAYSDQTTLERAQKTQPYGYLVKPFNIQQIHEIIEAALHPDPLNPALLQPPYSLKIIHDNH
jgi:CheY-like chemotaxis protein